MVRRGGTFVDLVLGISRGFGEVGSTIISVTSSSESSESESLSNWMTSGVRRARFGVGPCSAGDDRRGRLMFVIDSCDEAEGTGAEESAGASRRTTFGYDGYMAQ